MFSLTQKRRPLFGAPMPSAMGGEYDLSAAPATSSPGLSTGAQDAITPTYKKPSTANLIIGTIGDTLSQIGGGQGTYLKGLAQQRGMAAQAQQAQQERAAEYADWVRKKEYEQKNPTRAPYRFTANDGDVYELGADGKPQRLFDDPTPKTDWITAKNPDGTMQIIPMVGGRPAVGGAPAPQRQVIQQLPPGVKPIGGGGAAPSGPRTFPVR